MSAAYSCMYDGKPPSDIWLTWYLPRRQMSEALQKIQTLIVLAVPGPFSHT